MTLGMEVGLGPGHIVLDRDSALLPKKGAEPPSEPQKKRHTHPTQFLANVYCC